MNKSRIRVLKWIMVKHRGWVLYFSLNYNDYFSESMHLLLLLSLFIDKHLKPVEDCRDGNGARQVWRMGSCPIPALPHMTEKIFLPHLHPLEPREAPPHPTPPHPVKFYFLLICPTTSTIFLMKPILLIKIYLKLQLNLSYQIKSIFRKNWIIYPSV